MRRIRVVIEVEYELPDSAEIINIAGEPALRIDGHTIKPAIELWQLKEATSTTANWVAATEEAYDLVIAGELHTATHIAPSSGAP